MKSLRSFVTEQNMVSADFNNCDSIDEVYESLCNLMISDSSINEGFFSKLADAFRKGGEKLDAADVKIDQMSDNAKKAINKAKTKAGDKWNDIKDTYTSVVGKVDKVISNTKSSIENIAKQAGVKVNELESNLAAIYTSALAKGGDTAKKIEQYMSDKTKGAQYVTAINTLMLGAKMAKKSGIDSSLIIDLLDTAGIK